MKCNKCGTEIPVGKSFCGKCGTRAAYNFMNKENTNEVGTSGNASPPQTSSGAGPLVFGILALICSLLSCLVVPVFLGLIFAILGITMGSKCYRENGSAYARTGKILSIVALVIMGISLLVLIVVGGTAAYDQYQRETHPFKYYMKDSGVGDLLDELFR